MVPMDVERALRDALKGEDEIVWAYLFGSAVRGGAYRDVDVAVMPAPGAFSRLTDLGRLQVRLSAALDREVDLVDLRRASLLLLGPILRERRVLRDRDVRARHCWEAETASRVLDYEPVIGRYSSLRRERLRLRRARGA
ncbi:MAG: nucleotidyltransferase domain-containing protein [Deltaproteobacteria bacterium]|nr:nucleotidyltransferase domain-containing protein [Deltaproteobacteria bacterium]